MLFIDGDNLVSRFQAMLADGQVAQNTVIHRPNEYAWVPNFWIPGDLQIIRAYYYCSVAGDDTKLESVCDAIKRLRPMHDSARRPFEFLSPRVFKKAKQADKAKAVDIQMAVDALNHIHSDNLDVVCLVTGDGDFLPILHEAVRHGKRLCVAALSSGLNPQLKRLADEFMDLDACFIDQNARPVSG